MVFYVVGGPKGFCLLIMLWLGLHLNFVYFSLHFGIFSLTCCLIPFVKYGAWWSIFVVEELFPFNNHSRGFLPSTSLTILILLWFNCSLTIDKTIYLSIFLKSYNDVLSSLFKRNNFNYNNWVQIQVHIHELKIETTHTYHIHLQSKVLFHSQHIGTKFLNHKS